MAEDASFPINPKHTCEDGLIRPLVLTNLILSRDGGSWPSSASKLVCYMCGLEEDYMAQPKES